MSSKNFIKNKVCLGILWLSIFSMEQCKSVETRKEDFKDLEFLPQKTVSYEGVVLSRTHTAIGAYPYYLDDPFEFYRVQNGIGTFQERHLKENILRQEMNRKQSQNRAHQHLVIRSDYNFLGLKSP
ncbi:MAG: hypothetical protein SH817_10520 [Leptospira sp.]|nr:hypothetical protein [Leptospira sp.]